VLSDNILSSFSVTMCVVSRVTSERVNRDPEAPRDLLDPAPGTGRYVAPQTPFCPLSTDSRVSRFPPQTFFDMEGSGATDSGRVR